MKPIGVNKRTAALGLGGAFLVITGLVLWQVVLPLLSLEVESIDQPDADSDGPSAAVIRVGDYYQISYEPAEFSKTEIRGDEVFYAVGSCRTTCTGELLITPSQSETTSRYMAVHQASGAQVVLNPSHTVILEPVPSSKGDAAEVNEVVPLQFPAESQPGEYDVVAEIVEARVKVLLWWIDVTGYVPRSQTMGSVTYVATGIGSAGFEPEAR